MQGNYRPVAGQPLNPREWSRIMEQQHNQPEPQPQEAAAQNATEAQAAEQQGIPSREETEAMEAQRAQAAALLNGNGPGAAQTRVATEPFQLPLQAPDGGPLRVAPELVLQLRMLAIGAGIGALIVALLALRARFGAGPAPAPVAEKEAAK